MGTAPQAWRADAGDFDRIVEAFSRAALDEAVTAWILEDFPPDDFVAEFVPRTVERGLRDDEVWVAGADGEIWTVSIWQTLTSLQRFEEEAAETGAHAAQLPGVRPLQRSAYLTDLLAREHPREFPHSYVQVMVTVPEHRGKGSGAAVLADRVRACGAAGTPAFLEASTERSARLYAREGFVREGTPHQLPDNGPTLIPMWFRP
ncbi:GNAT family N-acetyltransferase [Nocardia donostiensis]|uniref:GNAT family N-acetyltransferase n=1 Tax=Nocardia donostiensis TaxID=1538463 RepID=A0A1V2T9F4_9NOCA|nr:GNAT family N-acetyltransferase [Nocardia donostiensis]ONM46078.1 GNAT family N-acetyltransferase [Nocardia donostiensis]OQS12419.1 GNAT family N-acetyltransferase [Nocardia donostiensis]OQS17966.1 GNAT family N-acetyltransferase [Nocardia donostiensis]